MSAIQLARSSGISLSEEDGKRGSHARVMCLMNLCEDGQGLFKGILNPRRT